MPADWDADSPQLQANLDALADKVADAALRREPITLDTIKGWHRDIMHGLSVSEPRLVGAFRSRPEDIVEIGTHEGVPPARVRSEARTFNRTLGAVVAELDELIPAGTRPDRDGLQAVTLLAAWAHSQWVRIHPFMNGNGRTARVLVNALLVRWRLKAVLRLRPRPDGAYWYAGARGMVDDVLPMQLYLLDALRNDAEGGAAAD